MSASNQVGAIVAVEKAQQVEGSQNCCQKRVNFTGF
jgi:hypothetical protein